jgi:hypothetical protein
MIRWAFLLLCLGCQSAVVTVDCTHPEYLCEQPIFVMECQNGEVCEYCEWNTELLCPTFEDDNCAVAQEYICSSTGEEAPCDRCLAVTVTKCYR